MTGFDPLVQFLQEADAVDAGRVAVPVPHPPAAYTTSEALLDFASAERLRDVRLLQESHGLQDGLQESHG